MKKLSLSKFDLGIIIAAVVVALLGGGAWYYLSGELQDAQADVAQAKTMFDTNSVSKSAGANIVVSRSNGKTLQANIDILKAELDPLIKTRLRPKENKIYSIDKEDPVAWKHDLDDEVKSLNAAAKLHSTAVPPNFYFGFSRYLNQSPNDEQTAVLSKQLEGIKQMTTILIEAQVKGIQAIRRTYEEDPHTGPGPVTESDHLAGYALVAPGNAYTVYPFEIEFETTPENFRTVIDNLVQSPYLFVVRSLTIKNSSPNSPQLNDLDKLAGPQTPSVIDTSPGGVAATPSAKGPQYLFGNSTLQIKARIDMVEWTAGVK